MNDQNPPSASPFQSIRTIDYTVILVRDMAAMRRFYEGVLRFPLTRELRRDGSNIRSGVTRSLCRGRAGRRRMHRHPQAARRCSSRSRSRLKTSIAAPTNWCGTVSICSSRRPTSPSAIARCSSGIPTGICWRCMRRFDAG